MKFYSSVLFAKYDIFRLCILAAATALAACQQPTVSTPAVGSFVTTLAGTADQYGSDDGTGAAALFCLPRGITSDGVDLYVADTGNNVIRRIAISTGAVTTLAGTAGSEGSDDGAGAAARFKSPYGIIIDGTDLYVADTNNSVIRRIEISTGAVTTLAGTAGFSGSVDGTGAAARFSAPIGITSDGVDLYVADTGNHLIRKIVISTRAVTTFAGLAASSGSVDGTGAAARFNYPSGITSDGTSLYVADTSNHTIRMILISSGEVATLAGLAGSSGSDDGAGPAARFKWPDGITSDGTDLYVADTNNHIIRKIVIPTGEVTTLAGTADLYGSIDGAGSAARFKWPGGITGCGGDLYVADTENHTIRVVTK